MKYKGSKIALGIFLIFFAFIGGGHNYIFDWGSAELVGRNALTLLLVGGGGYLIYKGLKSRKTPTTDN